MDFTAFDHLSLNFIEAFFPSFFSLLRLFPSPLGRGMATVRQLPIQHLAMRQE